MQKTVAQHKKKERFGGEMLMAYVVGLLTAMLLMFSLLFLAALLIHFGVIGAEKSLLCCAVSCGAASGAGGWMARRRMRSCGPLLGLGLGGLFFGMLYGLGALLGPTTSYAEEGSVLLLCCPLGGGLIGASGRKSKKKIRR